MVGPKQGLLEDPLRLISRPGRVGVDGRSSLGLGGPSVGQISSFPRVPVIISIAGCLYLDPKSESFKKWPKPHKRAQKATTLHTLGVKVVPSASGQHPFNTHSVVANAAHECGSQDGLRRDYLQRGHQRL